MWAPHGNVIALLVFLPCVLFYVFTAFNLVIFPWRDSVFGPGRQDTAANGKADNRLATVQDENWTLVWANDGMAFFPRGHRNFHRARRRMDSFHSYPTNTTPWEMDRVRSRLHGSSFAGRIRDYFHYRLLCRGHLSLLTGLDRHSGRGACPFGPRRRCARKVTSGMSGTKAAFSRH